MIKLQILQVTLSLSWPSAPPILLQLRGPGCHLRSQTLYSYYLSVSVFSIPVGVGHTPDLPSSLRIQLTHMQNFGIISDTQVSCGFAPQLSHGRAVLLLTLKREHVWQVPHTP